MIRETPFIYDGRRVIQERNGDTVLVTYTRGLDLSGSLEGAGGIGGLLARTALAASRPATPIENRDASTSKHPKRAGSQPFD